MGISRGSLEIREILSILACNQIKLAYLQGGQTRAITGKHGQIWANMGNLFFDSEMRLVRKSGMLLTIITPFEAKVKEMEEAPGKENGGRVRVSGDGKEKCEIARRTLVCSCHWLPYLSKTVQKLS